MGTLYIVSTPIGNLQDISSRAVHILTTADIIACEDTRRTGSLLKMLATHPSYVKKNETDRGMLVSYYEQNEFEQIPKIINALKNDLNVAVVSDAGTPGISDPGYRIVKACIEEGITVQSVPGPSSVTTALVVSGLPTDTFLFMGYPPRKPGHRKVFFDGIKSAITVAEKIHPTVILFEAPHKLKTTLNELKDAFGDISIVLCRELTKMYEEVRREKISSSVEHFSKKEPKGEFVLLFNLYMQ
jgi:16S rRNA (cytidine1402-2'-O)-methyltransferase